MSQAVLTYFFKLSQPFRLDVYMTIFEFMAQRFQFTGNILFRERQGTIDDGGYVLGFNGNEREDDDALAVRKQGRFMTAKMNGIQVVEVSGKIG